MVNAQSLVEINDLSISLDNGKRLVDNISFSMGRERVALVGESGSGKSLTARSLMGLLPTMCYPRATQFDVMGQPALSFNEKNWRKLRGSQVAMVLQDPKYALNPAQTIGMQVEEPLILHQKLSRRERMEQVEDIPHAVGLPNPAQLKKSLSTPTFWWDGAESDVGDRLGEQSSVADCG
ncbi:ATP-binding cassette domain-containing protein [Vibrio sp. PP-XX7]